MLGDALSFPRTGDDWIPTIIIGGILSLLSVLVIPGIILQGYFIRVLRSAVRDEAEAPSFTEWGELFVDGLKFLVINVAFSLVFMIPYAAFIFTLGYSGNDGVGALTLVLGLVVFVLALVIGYFIPASLANFAIEGSFGAAFDFGTIKSAALTGDYATAWILAIIVGIVGGLVGGLLSFLIVGLFVLFYVQVAVYYLFGRGFAKGLGRNESAAVSSPSTEL